MAAAGIGAAIGAGLNISKTLSKACWSWRELALNATIGAGTGAFAGITFGKGVTKLPGMLESTAVGAVTGAANARATGLGSVSEDAGFGAAAGAFGGVFGRAAGRAAYWRQFPYGAAAKREAQRTGAATGVISAAAVGGIGAGLLDFAYATPNSSSGDCTCQ